MPSTLRMTSMMKSIFASLALASALLLTAADPVTAQQQPQASAAPAQTGPLHVDINEGNLNPMPIAIVDFLAGNPAAQQVGGDIAGVIRADLDRSGLFHPIDQNAFIEHIQALEVPPRFADWKIISAQALVVGQITPMPEGRIQVEFRLWDVYSEQFLTGFRYVTTADNWRQIAHRISDQIYQQLTGESGYFDTRIVFVSESGPKTRRVKRLMIMDQDGANPSDLTSADAMVLTPRFSPSTQKITYMSFETGAP